MIGNTLIILSACIIMQHTLSLVARKQILGTIGFEDMVKVIMVVERGAKED